MKKALLVLALAFLATASYATTVPMGMAQVPVDSNGNLTGLPITGAVVIPTPTPGTIGVSITAMPAIESAVTTQVYWTQTPVAYNLSTTAGVAGKKYIVTVQPNFGGAGVFVDFASLTWTAAINTGYGRYLPTTLTGGVAYGPYAAGFHLIVKTSTATNVSGTVSIECVP